MTVQEAIMRMKRTRDNDPFVGTPYCNEKRKAYETAIKSLEAWKEVKKEVDEIINRPHLNMMEYELALKEIRDIIKEHLGEVEE